jgi:hypothetical protein
MRPEETFVFMALPTGFESGVRTLRIKDMRAQSSFATEIWYHLMSFGSPQMQGPPAAHEYLTPAQGLRELISIARLMSASKHCKLVLDGARV